MVDPITHLNTWLTLCQLYISYNVNFIPHLVFSTRPIGELGLFGSIFGNITWAMGTNLKVELSREGTCGKIDANGSFYGGFKDLMNEVCALWRAFKCTDIYVLYMCVYGYSG